MLRDEFDAILFGALGDPRVPSNQHAADTLLGLRFKLDLYVNVRPTTLSPQTYSVARSPTGGDQHGRFRKTRKVYTLEWDIFKKGQPTSGSSGGL